MTKSKKTADQMTDEELEKRVFPKRVLDELKRVAHEGDDDKESEAQQPSQD